MHRPQVSTPKRNVEQKISYLEDANEDLRGQLQSLLFMCAETAGGGSSSSSPQQHRHRINTPAAQPTGIITPADPASNNSVENMYSQLHSAYGRATPRTAFDTLEDLESAGRESIVDSMIHCVGSTVSLAAFHVLQLKALGEKCAHQTKVVDDLVLKEGKGEKEGGRREKGKEKKSRRKAVPPPPASSPEAEERQWLKAKLEEVERCERDGMWRNAMLKRELEQHLGRPLHAQ